MLDISKNIKIFWFTKILCFNQIFMLFMINSASSETSFQKKTILICFIDLFFCSFVVVVLLFISEFSGMVLKQINNINVLPQMYRRIPFSPFQNIGIRMKQNFPSTQQDISWNFFTEDETNLWKFQQNNKNFSFINSCTSYLFLRLSSLHGTHFIHQLKVCILSENFSHENVFSQFINFLCFGPHPWIFTVKSVRKHFLIIIFFNNVGA